MSSDTVTQTAAVQTAGSPADQQKSSNRSTQTAVAVGGLAVAAATAAVTSGPTMSGKGGKPANSDFLTLEQASRFLAQAAPGHSYDDIVALTKIPFPVWITQQFTMSRPSTFWNFLLTQNYQDPNNQYLGNGHVTMLWTSLITSADLLRQRVGMALLHFLVVGKRPGVAAWTDFRMAAYCDGLWNNAFGNYRDIISHVTLSPAMGNYLSFLGNKKADPKLGTLPDENFARELMQLFTIGLYKLKMDGTLDLDANGMPQPTYTQTDITQMARVWTGYTLAGDPADYNTVGKPMIVDPTKHETGPITALNGRLNVPAGHDAETARQMTIDALFSHDNTPPFVCKQLIQRLVTSNPSPAYVGRVAAAFCNNGNGVRGDMKAVIRAILTDQEARDDIKDLSSTTFGKLREPMFRLIHWARAVKLTSKQGKIPFGDTTPSATQLSECPGFAPSVFGWCRPGYAPPGTPISDAGLVAPEFQMVSEPGTVGDVNWMDICTLRGTLYRVPYSDALPDYTPWIPIGKDANALVDRLNLVFAAGQISPTTIAEMKRVVAGMTVSTDDGVMSRVRAAMLLVLASPEYIVQR